MPHLNVEQWDRLNRLFQKELASSSLKERKHAEAIPGFLDLRTVDNLNQIILCCEGCPGHYRMFHIIPGLYLPETNSITPVMTIKNVFKTLQISSGQEWPGLPLHKIFLNLPLVPSELSSWQNGLLQSATWGLAHFPLMANFSYRGIFY